MGIFPHNFKKGKGNETYIFIVYMTFYGLWHGLLIFFFDDELTLRNKNYRFNFNVEKIK